MSQHHRAEDDPPPITGQQMADMIIGRLDRGGFDYLGPGPNETPQQLLRRAIAWLQERRGKLL